MSTAGGSTLPSAHVRSLGLGANLREVLLLVSLTNHIVIPSAARNLHFPTAQMKQIPQA